jgi:ZIP family zinc transporter
MDQIIEYFSGLNPVVGALYATLFTWGVTALGASTTGFNPEKYSIIWSIFVY